MGWYRYLVFILYFLYYQLINIFYNILYKLFLHLNFRITKLKFKLEPAQREGSGYSQIPVSRLRAAKATAIAKYPGYGRLGLRL